MENKFELMVNIEEPSDEKHSRILDALDTLGNDVNFSFEEEGTIHSEEELIVKYSIVSEASKESLFEELDKCGLDFDFSFTLSNWSKQGGDVKWLQDVLLDTEEKMV